MYQCRHAHDLFNSIAAPLRLATVVGVNWLPVKLPEETPWARGTDPATPDGRC